MDKNALYKSRYYFCRKHNKDNSIPLDDAFTLKYFLTELSTKVCVYCGTRQNLKLDIINKYKGYTTNNVKVACEKCIKIRHAADVPCEVMLEIMEIIKRNEEKIEENQR